MPRGRRPDPSRMYIANDFRDEASPPPSGREARFLIMGTMLALIVVGTIAYLQSIGVIQ